MVAWVGDESKDWSIQLFADADLSGCKKTWRSTSGGFAILRGSDTAVPLAQSSKRQRCVSKSTPEAEVVAADHALRTLGIPNAEGFALVLKRDLTIDFLEDNSATIQICEKGSSPALRHVGRTHGISIAWLHELFRMKIYNLKKIESEQQAADIFTKEFHVEEKWQHALTLINVVNPAKFWGTPLTQQKQEMRIGKMLTPRPKKTSKAKAKAEPKNTAKNERKNMRLNVCIRGERQNTVLKNKEEEDDYDREDCNGAEAAGTLNTEEACQSACRKCRWPARRSVSMH
jgi:hypothetical protein